MFKLAFLSYLTMFNETIFEFPVKKEVKFPPGGNGRKIKVAGFGSEVFREKSKWRTKIHTRLT